MPYVPTGQDLDGFWDEDDDEFYDDEDEPLDLSYDDWIYDGWIDEEDEEEESMPVDYNSQYLQVQIRAMNEVGPDRNGNVWTPSPWLINNPSPQWAEPLPYVSFPPADRTAYGQWGEYTYNTGTTSTQGSWYSDHWQQSTATYGSSQQTMTPLQLARQQNGNRGVLLDAWIAPLYKYLSNSAAWGSTSAIAHGTMMHQVCEAIWHARNHLLKADIDSVQIFVCHELGSGEYAHFDSAALVNTTHCSPFLQTAHSLADLLVRGYREVGQEVKIKDNETLVMWLNPALIHRKLKLEDRSVYSVFTKAYLTKTAVDALEEIPELPRPKIRKLLRD